MESNALRTCRICKEEKDLSEFYKNGAFIRWECSLCYLKSMRNNYHNKKAEYKNRQLKNRYGINLDQYEKLLKEQEDRCKICKRKQDENIAERKLAVDHDHVTGKIRGLLCGRCNLCVEYLESNPGWADKALAYLQKYR